MAEKQALILDEYNHKLTELGNKTEIQETNLTISWNRWKKKGCGGRKRRRRKESANAEFLERKSNVKRSESAARRKKKAKGG